MDIPFTYRENIHVSQQFLLNPLFFLFAYSSKLFNCCLKKKKCFPSLCTESAVCPVFKNEGELMSTLQYYPISLVSVISKFLEPTIKKVVDYLSNLCWLKDSEYTNCPTLPMRPPIGCGWLLMMPGDGILVIQGFRRRDGLTPEF